MMLEFVQIIVADKSDKLAHLLVFLSMYGKMAVGGRS